MAPDPNRKQLTLSPEARAKLALPLEANGVGQIFERGTGAHFASIFSAGNYHVDAEIAAFIAELVNEALTPVEPVRMCADLGCLNAADPTTPSGAFCFAHDVALRTECGVAPETNGELTQIVTNEFEASNPELRAQVAYYDWTNDGEAVLRREG